MTRVRHRPNIEYMLIDHLKHWGFSILRHMCVTWPLWINSLVPGRFEWDFRHVIFKQILVIDGWGICCASEIALIWMSLDTDDQSTLVQVMAWCRQATSHYLSQCWPRSVSSYGITRPQWVNLLAPGKHSSIFKHVIFISTISGTLSLKLHAA